MIDAPLNLIGRELCNGKLRYAFHIFPRGHCLFNKQTIIKITWKNGKPIWTEQWPSHEREITGVCQGCILSPCLFNLYVECIMRNAGLEKAQAGIKIAGEIPITSDMQMTPPLWQKVK